MIYHKARLCNCKIAISPVLSVLIARLLLATMFLRLVLVQPLRVLFGGLWDRVILRLSSATVPFSGATSSPRLCVATTTSSQASWNDDAGGLGFGLMHGNWGGSKGVNWGCLR